ncbi:MAG TPA: biopolymer transporter ExbD [Candidatus Aminicenantes bacterium]|nr:biopolymer transporter ExbD [Candidatus Aminicenantes bacterium]HEB36395.1 biopolymer transporter ExbD [Candidatus Aminicenantes bacterium]
MSSIAEPNVVPLCDVLLVLLIIFMVITPMVQKGVDVKLPDTSTEQSSTPVGVIVMTLHNNMKVDINQRYMEFDLVQNELRTIYAPRQDKTIFIRADARIPYSKVIELMDIARGAGVEVLGIIPEYFTEEEETENL